MRDIQDWWHLSSAVVGSPYPGVSLVNDGNVYWPYRRRSASGEITSVPTFASSRDEDVLDTVLLRAVDLLHPRLAENANALRRFRRSVMVSASTISSGCPHDHDDQPLHQKDENGEAAGAVHANAMTGLIRDDGRRCPNPGNVIDPLDMVDGISTAELLGKTRRRGTTADGGRKC